MQNGPDWFKIQAMRLARRAGTLAEAFIEVLLGIYGGVYI